MERKILLLGYMGSGKSTVGKMLSDKTGISFLDLDSCIENNAMMSIGEIFETRGEIFFRNLEHKVFLELMNSTEEIILALGGGTPCYSDNHTLLVGDNVFSFYLKSSVQNLVNRLVLENDKRPLIAGKTEVEIIDFIAPHIFERSFYYQKSKYTIDVDCKSVEQIASEIAQLLS